MLAKDAAVRAAAFLFGVRVPSTEYREAQPSCASVDFCSREAMRPLFMGYSSVRASKSFN